MDHDDHAFDRVKQDLELALSELRRDYPTWRIGRGGSGHYWAIQHDTILTAKTITELRTQLRATRGEYRRKGR